MKKKHFLIFSLTISSFIVALSCVNKTNQKKIVFNDLKEQNLKGQVFQSSEYHYTKTGQDHRVIYYKFSYNIITTYNKSGDITEIVYSDSSSTPKKHVWVDNQYDSIGRKISAFYRHEDTLSMPCYNNLFPINHKDSYSYNQDGTIKRIQYFMFARYSSNSNSDVKSFSNYDIFYFNDSNNIAEKCFFSKDFDSLLSTKEYSYDSKNNLISQKTYRKKEHILSDEHSYNPISSDTCGNWTKIYEIENGAYTGHIERKLVYYPKR